MLSEATFQRMTGEIKDLREINAELYEALAECEELLRLTKHKNWQGDEAQAKATAALAKSRGVPGGAAE